MKSYLKLLMAMILVLSCIAIFASCNDDADGNGDANDSSDVGTKPDIVIPPSSDVQETYLVQFVYRYYLTYINDYDRMESKPFTERKVTLEIPINNSGFTAEQLAQIAGIKHNGYSFMDWYLGWDEDNYRVTGEAFDFANDNAPITSDLTFYGYRGNLAGETATWEIAVEGEGKAQETVLYINGTGATFDYEAVTNIDIPWYEQRAKITKIVIAEGITDIGANTFNGLYGVDTIEFPDSLVSVGTSSFRGMTKLTSLETPANLKVIGSNAFAETSIKSIVFNEGLEEIGDTAFNESNKIVSIIIPSTLKKVKGAAFHRGSVDGTVNASALKYVYSLGTEEQFAAIEIGLDNAWFSELASVYFKPADGVDPEEVEGPYWDYYSYEDEEGELVVTDTPVPYYYMVKYFLNSSVYGITTPIFVDYVATDVAVEEDGTMKITATVTADNVAFADNIVYHNFKFVRFTNAVTEGLVLSDARSVTCEVYSNTRVTPSATATGTNKGYLSNKGGIVWEFSFSTRTLTISLGVKLADLENVTALLKKAVKFDSEITAETLISDIFGIETAEAIKNITDVVGFDSVEEFAALAAKLAALEISGSNDPLIATATALAEAGIVTVDDLAALVAAIDADGADEDADLQATLADLAEASLDAQNLKDLYAKLVSAEIAGNIADEFTSLKSYLQTFEEEDILITDIHAAMIARSEAMAALAAACVKEYKVGDADVFDAAITVADLIDAISDLQDAEGLFDTWDYATSEDTSVMWASSRSYTSLVKKIVIGEGIKHLGSFVFANLPYITELVLPESLESIDVNAIDGCPDIKSVYYVGTDLSEVAVLDAKTSTVAGDLTADRILLGNYASVYAYTESATAEEGKYWTNVGDSKVAWSLSAGTLRIGGPTEMVNFAAPEEAPWYGAKDSITKVVIANHIVSVGENIANGYANVAELDISEGYGAVKYIPATAFAGTAIVNGEGRYDKYDSNGMLIVNDYLIGYNGDAEFVKVPFWTISVVEGAFDNNANLKYVSIPQTVLGLHPAIFYNNLPTIIYFEGGSADWYNVIGDIVVPEDAEYYVALTSRKADDDTDFFFLYKQEGNEFIILDGCIHDFTDWVQTKDPTCSQNGEKQRVCQGDCGKTFTDVVPKLGHDWSDWTPCVDAPTYEERWCQNANCDAVCSVDGCTVHASHADDCADDCTAHNQAAHEKFMINSEYTFEGIEEVNDNQIKLSDTTNSTYTIVEIGTDAHAFEYEKTGKDTSAEFTVFATQSGTLATAKVITYKSDLKIDNTNKKVSIDLVFRSESEPSNIAMVLNLLATDGQKLDVGARSGYGADAVLGEYVSLGVKTGEWFTLKVEYYAEGAASVAKVYVNEKLVYITDVFYGSEATDAAPVSAAVADSVSFAPANNYLGKISLDNVTLTQSAEYEFDGKTSLISAITFDEVPPASLVKVDGTATIVTNEDNKYYSLNRASTSNGYYTFYPQSTANSANVAIFETDLQITRTEGSRAWAIRFRGGPVSNAYMAEFRHDATTGTLWVADKSHSNDGIGYKTAYVQPTDEEGNPVNIQVGDWVNVRIEYYEAKAGDAESVRMITYINGVPVLYSNNWYGVSTEQETGSAGTVPHPAKISEITDVYIQPYTSHRGEWNIDNTLFYTTYGVAPTDPVTLKYDDFDGGAMNDGNGNIYTDYPVEDDRAKALKNLINEEVDEDEEDIFAPDIESSKVVTFDDVDAIPACIECTDVANPRAFIATEGTNKFFYFERITTTSTSKRFKIYPTGNEAELPTDADLVVLEAKMKVEAEKIDGTKSTTFQLIMMDRLSGSDYANRAYLLEIDVTDGNILVKDKSHNTDSLVPADGKVDPVATTATAGDWFTLRVEYNEAGVAKTYINEKLVLESDNFYGITTENPNATPVQAEIVDCVYVAPYSNFSGYIAIDDVYFWREKAAPEREYVTFDDLEAVPAQIALNSGNGTLSLVTEEGNKFFRVTEGSNSTRFTVGLTEDAVEGASSVVFEAKMRYNLVRDDGNGATNMFFTKEGDTSSRAFEFQFNYIGGNIIISTREGTDATGAATTQKDFETDSIDTGIKLNDWFKIKLEYTDEGKLIVSINGDVVLESTNYYDKFNGAMDAADVAGIWFVPFGSTTGNIDFDDLAYYQVKSDSDTPAPHEHKFVDGKCECGEPDPDYVPEDKFLVPEDALSFEDITPKTLAHATGGASLGLAGGNITAIYQTAQSGIASVVSTAIVQEGNNKYLSISRTALDGASAQSWINLVLDNTATADLSTVVFETRMRLNITQYGSGFRIRMYTGSRSTSSGGTEVVGKYFGSGYHFGDSSAANRIDIGVTGNEWFTMRIAVSDYTDETTPNYVVSIYDEVTEKFVEKYSSVAASVTDASAISCICFMDSTTTIMDADFAYFYYGAEPVYPTPDDGETDEPVEEEEELLEGTVTFDDISVGDWVVNTGDSVLFGHMVQANATSTLVVAEEDGNKYLSMYKSGCASDGARQSWIVIEKTAAVPAGTPIVFETRIRHTPVQGSATYFRFYTDRTAGNPNGGSGVYGSSGAPRNVGFKADSGNMMLDGTIDLGAKSGEWFTLRFVFLGNTLTVFTNDENGEMIERGSITRAEWADFKDIKSIILMNDSTTFHKTDFDNVYFGPYVPEVESPIENLPNKESDLATGTLTFNSIEEAALPEQIDFITDGDSNIGVVAVSRTNKVLSFDKNAGEIATMYLNATTKTVGANTLSFATQMYFDVVDADGYVDYTLMPSGAAEGDRVYKVRVSVAEGKISVAPVALVDGADVVGAAVDTGVAVGTWFKLAIAYTEADGKFVVSVNGDAVINSEAAYGMYKDASAISQVAISASAELAADIYFENMSLSQLIAE